MRALPLVVLVVMSSVLACENKDKDVVGPKFALPNASMTPVVSAAWGSGSADLARHDGQEAASRGPESFSVDASGTVFVLDQENSRIQRYAAAAPPSAIPIPNRPFVDLELDGTSGFGLLQLDPLPAIVFVGLDGTPASEIAIVADQMEEASALTALVHTDSGWYVEAEGEYLVRIADPSHTPVEQETLPGRLVTSDAVFGIEAPEPNQFTLIRQALDQDPEPVADVAFSEPMAEITLFAAAPDSSLLLAARLMGAQSDPAKPPSLSHQLVVIQGSSQKRELLPLPGGDLDAFRSVRQGADGNVYVMTFGSNGVELGKVSP